MVLYLRHGVTDNRCPCRLGDVNLEDCPTQRPQAEAGRVLAAQVDRALGAERIAVTDILCSTS